MVSAPAVASRANPIRVLVVDDSALVRKMLRDMLAKDPAIEVVGAAYDGEEALRMFGRLRPDVVTLDITMPVMDGLTVLRKIMAENPRPCVMVSALTQEGARTTLEALQIGAVDFVAKPTIRGTGTLQEQAQEVVAKVKAAAGANVLGTKGRRAHPPRKQAVGQAGSHGGRRTVVAIGASTGGPKALMDVIPLLPPDLPAAVLVVQHMPGTFTGSFAARLDQSSKLRVKEAAAGESVSAGTGYVAPGGLHMCVTRVGPRDERQIVLSEQPQDALHRPSVNVMMQSVAGSYGAEAMGVLLTGMGADGADGMLAIQKAGGETIAQDEESCVIFGMPKEAVKKGGVKRVLPIERIADAIVEAVT